MRQWKRLSLIAVLAAAFSIPSPAWGAAKVVIDAGHGGSDPGAIGVNGIREEYVNLDIAVKLGQALIAQGYEVVQTRGNDKYLSLKERVAFSERQDAHLFVSIHANSFTSPNARGAMVLYHDRAYPNPDYPASEAMKALTPESKDLAQKVLDSLVSSVGLQNKGLLPSSVYVVRMGSIPSILVETAFLSNGADAALLADSAIRSKMASAIAEGIRLYLPPDSIEAVFSDLRRHWVKDAVKRLKAKQIVQGTGRGYEPERPVTRAEWAAMLDRSIGLTADGGISVTESVYETKQAAEAAFTAVPSVQANTPNDAPTIELFKDIRAEHWAYDMLKKAVAAGVLEGYSDGTLRPDNQVTRAEAASLLRRMTMPSSGLSSTASLDPPPFIDVPLEHWAYEDIALLHSSSLINGVTPDSFAPDKPMTRAEAAALLDRLMNDQQLDR